MTQFYRFHKPGFKKRQSAKLRDPNARNAILVACDLNEDPKIVSMYAQKDHALLGLYLEILFNLDLQTETWEINVEHFDRWARRIFADGAPNFKIRKRLEWFHKNGLVFFEVKTGCLNTPFETSKPTLNPIQTEGKPQVNTPFKGGETSAALRARITNQHNKEVVATTSEFFERFKSEYPPDHFDDVASRTLWAATDLEQYGEAILTGLQAWKGSGDWEDNGGQFIPSASNFLERKRWERKPRRPKADSPQPKRTHLKHWEAGGSFRYIDSGAVVEAASLVPCDGATGREGVKTPTGFKSLKTGEYEYFVDFEII